MDKPTQSQLPATAREVLDFWYRQLEPKQWWIRDDAVDQDIISRFGALYIQLVNDIPESWLMTARGRLAAVIVLDQFPRNMFQGSEKTFMSDARALAIAEETIDAGLDKDLTQEERPFLCMPFMHSEDLEKQDRSIELFAALGDEDQLEFARKHKLIIERFGRFPHRNDVIGRNSSKAELEFLKEPGLFW